MNLLLVEDEPDIIELMIEVFDPDAKKIWTAQDGLEGLEKIEEHPEINCVISDINMPRMNGIGLCQRIRESRPELPVILITAEVANGPKAWESGASDVIIKPFDMLDLYSRALALWQTAQPVKKE